MAHIPEHYADLLRLVERLDGTANPDGSLKDTGPAHDVLAALIHYDTSSSNDPKLCKSNVELVKALQHCFKSLGLDTLYSDADEYPPGSGIKQATLVACMGPKAKGGIVLSGHTDVIPAPSPEHDQWNPTHDPFTLGDAEDKLVGRGTIDMKQGIYNMLAIADLYSTKKHLLDKPVYMALSWGEEIGCKGTNTTISLLEKAKADPELVIVGEPTGGTMITGHKGGSNIRVTLNVPAKAVPAMPERSGIEISIHSIGGHSSVPDHFINANEYADQMLEQIAFLQQKYEGQATINLTRMESGPSPNSVPSLTTLGISVGAKTPVTRQQVLEAIRDSASILESKLKEDTESLAAKIKNPDVDKRKSSISVTETPATQADASLAITVASQLRRALAQLQESYKEQYATVDNGFYPPYPIINLGVIAPGTSPGSLTFGIHIRPTSREESIKITEAIRDITTIAETKFGKGSVTLEKLSETIALPNQAVGTHRQNLLNQLCTGMEKVSGHPLAQALVSYATEAGGISEGLAKIHPDTRKKNATATIVYGVGNIDRAHRPNEYITRPELAESLQFPLMAIWELCVGPDKKLNTTPDITIIPTAPAKHIEQAQRQQR